MKQIGIKYQLRIITSIPILLVAMLFALVYNTQYNNALNQQMTRLGHAFINQLLPAARQAMQHRDRVGLQTLIEASSVNPEIKALAFYNAKGQLLAYHGGNHATLTSFTPPISPVSSVTSQQSSPYSVTFTSPITPPGKQAPLGWVSMKMDTQPILIKRYQMYIFTIFITLIGLLIGLSIHYVLSRKIHRPITRLRRRMKQILNNEFETTIHVSSSGELGIIEQGCAHLQSKYLSIINELNHHIEIATTDLQQGLELLEEKNIDLSLEKKKSDEKSRQKSEFIANMSHEIRTPMNGVIGFSNVLLDSQLDALQVDYVKTIKSSAQDLLAIINDILDYSKMDAGKLHLDSIPLNIRTCIDDVLALIAPNAHSKGIDLIPITAVDVPNTILGDPLRLKQIISSLVSNAVKFTDHGYVLVRTRIEQETDTTYTFCVSIADTGIGISSEDQTQLFNAFNQANTSITRRYGGTGLGLVICKQLAEHMQGRIVIHSELHKGSTFSVYLTLEKLAAYEIEKHQTHRFANIKAICFDDNPLYLEALCNGLNYWGIQCIQVQHLNQLAATFTHHPDCQLAFINVNQGCEPQISHILHQQTMPCLLISKWFIPNHTALGAQGLLFKPPNIKKLHDAIEIALNQSSNTKIQNQELATLRAQLHKANPQLLIAEDNRVNQLLLNALLGKSAHIDTVDDGEQTVALCNKKRFSAILLDLQMPKLNGLDAAREIRQSSLLNKDTPIILISANGKDIQQERLHKAGIDLCLQKPVEEKQLLLHLLQIISKSNTNAINWPLCVKKSSGNHALAVDFLTQFVMELHKNREEFIQLNQDNDLLGLAFVAHKLHGACCFCGVTQLQQQVAHLEGLARQVSHVDALQPEFLKLIEHIDAVLHEYGVLDLKE
ncbi:MAG TPA: hybrid sensor histidine kinase/response regulator [Legionella sp.]|nr:hybrid sensor histidine kinase/response regulator [Legionella sp.]